MRLLLLLLITIVISLSTMSCSKEGNKTSFPTDKQISDFIEQKKIHVIQTKNVLNEITVILYQDINEVGYYMLYQDKNGTLYNKKVSGVLIPNEQVYLSGSATNLPFVTVILGKKILDKSPAKVEVTFKDGTIVEDDLSNKKGSILPYTKKIEGNLSYSKLRIFTADNEIIFEK